MVVSKQHVSSPMQPWVIIPNMLPEGRFRLFFNNRSGKLWSIWGIIILTLLTLFNVLSCIRSKLNAFPFLTVFMGKVKYNAVSGEKVLEALCWKQHELHLVVLGKTS